MGFRFAAWGVIEGSPYSDPSVVGCLHTSRRGVLSLCGGLVAGAVRFLLRRQELLRRQ